jgi:hypothetical protein
MMYACNKCLSNQWKYELIENWVRATCQVCGSEVEWENKKKLGKRKWFVGSKCKCGKGVLVLKELRFKGKKLKKTYYYSHALFCSACHRFYYEEQYKVYNQDVCQKNIEASIALGLEQANKPL